MRKLRKISKSKNKINRTDFKESKSSSRGIKKNCKNILRHEIIISSVVHTELKNKLHIDSFSQIKYPLPIDPKQKKPFIVFSALFASSLFLIASLDHTVFRWLDSLGSPLAILAYTIFLGIFFCNLRESTDTLWPAILLHMLINSFTVLRNLGGF
jgi:hypothetical protein